MRSSQSRTPIHRTNIQFRPESSKKVGRYPEKHHTRCLASSTVRGPSEVTSTEDDTRVQSNILEPGTSHHHPIDCIQAQASVRRQCKQTIVSTEACNKAPSGDARHHHPKSGLNGHSLAHSLTQSLNKDNHLMSAFRNEGAPTSAWWSGLSAGLSPP